MACISHHMRREISSTRIHSDLKSFLLHKKEIEKLSSKMKEKGFTIVPVEVYFKGSLVKVEIALAKGKKLYDKRADIAKKDQKREAQRDFKIRNLG